jgi:hypothetical protein
LSATDVSRLLCEILRLVGGSDPACF